MKLELLYQIRRSTLQTLEAINNEIERLNPPWEEVVFQGEKVIAIKLCRKQLGISLAEAQQKVAVKYEEWRNAKKLHS